MQLLTIDQAAQRLAVSRRSVERLLARGALTALHPTGTSAVRVDLAEVEALVGAQPAPAPGTERRTGERRAAERRAAS